MLSHPPPNSSGTPIFERFELGLNLRELRDYVADVMASYPPVMQTARFGGWSVLSSNGDYQDGWGQGQLAFVETPTGPQVNEAASQAANAITTASFKHPTQIHRGYVVSVLEQIKARGILVRRVRVSVLKANSESSWHRDAMPDQYSVRLHIPVITNQDCLFRIAGHEQHAPADGAGYFVSVNQLHQVCNRSAEDRVHIFMDAIDIRGVTQFHRLPVKTVST